MKQHFKLNGWQDFLELTLASWIIASPFALGFIEQANASLTMMLVGSVMVLFAILGMATENPWDEWMNMFLGVLLIASPWLFGFASLYNPTINAVVCGGVIISLTILAMTHDYHEMNVNIAKEL